MQNLLMAASWDTRKIATGKSEHYVLQSSALKLTKHVQTEEYVDITKRIIRPIDSSKKEFAWGQSDEGSDQLAILIKPVTSRKRLVQSP